jgi:hypothetical protein
MELLMIRLIVLLCPLLVVAPGWCLTLNTHSQMQDHISVLDQADQKQSNGDSITSHVASLSGHEYELQGNASSTANSDGMLQVSSRVTSDTYDGNETFFRSSASWSETYACDSGDHRYLFDFTLSDIQVGASWLWGGAVAGYDVDVYLNDVSIFSNSFIFDTQPYFTSSNEDPNNISSDFTVPDWSSQIDLGYFNENENFTLSYGITSYVLPGDLDYAYACLNMTGGLSFSNEPISESQPIPEPATIVLLICGLPVISSRMANWKNKTK